MQVFTLICQVDNLDLSSQNCYACFKYREDKLQRHN